MTVAKAIVRVLLFCYAFCIESLKSIEFMPIIRIDFDDEKVTESDIIALSSATQKIVSEATGIEDVFVYGNSSQIKLKIAPIEIFVEMSAQKIKDREELIGSIKSRLTDWKKQTNFEQPINLTLIPMDWNIEIGI